MFCKIVIDNDKGSGKILRYLEEYKDDYLVVTQDYYDILEKNGINAKTILELIPETSEENSCAIKSACEKIIQYREIFEGIKYKDLPIFDGLENFLVEESIWIEKMTMILQMKQNILLLVKNISFSCFAILKVAKEIGYETEDNLAVIVVSDKIEKYNVFDNLDSIEKSTRRKNAISLFANSKIDLSKTVLKHALKKMRGFDEDDVLRHIGRKIQGKTDAVFFLATDIDDFLIPYYRVMERCNQTDIKFLTVSIDITTRKCLQTHEFEFLDLFDEVYILQNLIKNSKEFRPICNKIENRAKAGNIHILSIEKLPSFIQTKIAHSIAITIITDHILEKCSPRAVCIGTDGSTLANIVARLSSMRGIKSLSIEPGILNEGLERKNHYKADRICIYGKQGAAVLENMGYEKKRIHITGNPRYDSIRDADRTKVNVLLKKRYKIKDDTKKIMIAMSRWHRNDDIWIPQIIKKCSETNCEVMIKIHPIYATQNLELNNRFVRSINEKSKGMKFSVISDINSSRLLEVTDIVITDYSNVGIEAMLRGIPLITVNFDNEDTRYMQKFHQTDLAVHVSTIEDLSNTINDIISNKSTNKNQNIHKISDLFNFQNDGNATERICKLLVGEN